jgi:hypothetical protein
MQLLKTIWQTRDRALSLQRPELKSAAAAENPSDRREPDVIDRVAQRILPRLEEVSSSHRSRETTGIHRAQETEKTCNEIRAFIQGVGKRNHRSGHLSMDAPRTKDMIKVLENIKAGKKALIVMSEKDENVIKSAANIPGVRTALVTTMNVYEIINYTNFIITKDAVNKIEEVYS